MQRKAFLQTKGFINIYFSNIHITYVFNTLKGLLLKMYRTINEYYFVVYIFKQSFI